MTRGIYALHDGDGDYRYVGQSIDIANRLRGHVRGAHRKRTPVQCWMAKRLASGGTIHVTVLEVVTNRNNLSSRERWWIRDLRGMGYRLLNVTEGGEGGATMLGRRHTDASREKVRAAKVGKKLSADHIARATAGRTRHPVSCVPCQREFPSHTALSAHNGSVHKGGNVKRRESLTRMWSEGRRVPAERDPATGRFS